MSRLLVNGAHLYVEDYGSGTPLVFLPGLAVGLRFFEPQLSELADRYRTIAVDYRGHGRSEATEIGYTLAQFAADIEGVLERLDVTNAVLVGWSLGALLSWEYVDRYGFTRIQGLVDVDMEPSPYQRDGYPYGTYTIDSLQESLTVLHTDRFAAIEEAIDRLCKEPPTGRLRTMMVDEMSRCPPTVHGSLMLTLIRDYRPVLQEIDVPTLVCVGMDGKWRSPESVEHTAEFLSDVRLERFLESGHCLSVEEPDRFSRVIERFAESL